VARQDSRGIRIPPHIPDIDNRLEMVGIPAGGDQFGITLASVGHQNGGTGHQLPVAMVQMI
jgi:hypothetical protein